MINKRVLTRTRQSLIKINLVVVSSLLFIFSIFIFFYFKGLTYNGLDKKLNEEFEYIASQLPNSLFFSPRTKDPRNLVYVYENDRIKYYTPNGYFDGMLPNKKNNDSGTFFTYIENGYTFRELQMDIGKYKVQIIRNIDSEINLLRQLIFVFIIGIIILVAITYFVAIYLTKKALIPIEIAWNNQAKFIQDASHELRTPIAIVSSKLESLLRVPNSTISDEVETIADAMKETRRIKKMISDLLSLTKEDSITKVNLEKINLVKLVEEISNDYEDIAQMQNKNFYVNFNLEEIIIINDKNKLTQLIRIFIDNAFKYTEENDSITIEIKDNDNNIIISIIDTGIGIKEEEIPYIFDRFFRSEIVRNRDIDGSGIGLSIAKMLSLNINSEINVKSILNRGTEFSITLSK